MTASQKSCPSDLDMERIRRIIDKVINLSRADQTEVVVLRERNELTRFANSRIHQNVAEENIQIRVRAILGKRSGIYGINSTDLNALSRASRGALELARLSPENPDFSSLPGPFKNVEIHENRGFSQATACCTPEHKSDGVEKICRLAGEYNLVAAGAFSTSVVEFAVGNSSGSFSYAPLTSSDLSAVVMSDNSSGYSGNTAIDIRDIDPERIGKEAVEKALQSRNPQAFAPGKYPVFLETYAVAELLSNLSILGFGALAFQQGSSFLSQRIGEKITGEEITIWDDGLDPAGLVMPFDYEGVPKQHVVLIKNGVASGPVYDSLTAGKESKSSTGHACLTPALYIPGPQAGNLFLKPGTASRTEMLEALGTGILVTRLHYVSAVDQGRTIVTGMTRDGTFWVEGGEIRYPLKNLRFTQSILSAFECVRAISGETRLRRDEFGAVRVPALVLDSFHFTEAGEF